VVADLGADFGPEVSSELGKGRIDIAYICNKAVVLCVELMSFHVPVKALVGLKMRPPLGRVPRRLRLCPSKQQNNCDPYFNMNPYGQLFAGREYSDFFGLST
jgi:hypothetical protein